MKLILPKIINQKYFVLVLLLLFFAVEFFLFVIAKRAGNAVLPPLFGNFPGVIRSMGSKETGDEFSFAVVGDPNNSGTFKELLRKIEERNPAFLILLGDCVDSGTKASHTYFKAEMSKNPMPFPIFYLIGNHDVAPKHFTVREFENDYGPSNFSFVYHDCLFIGLRIFPKTYSNNDSVMFLKDTLEEAVIRHYRAVFVFMHAPPCPYVDFGLDLHHPPEGKELAALFNQFHVDYVFAGHYHGYAAVRSNNTEYIISGGGGSHLYGHKSMQFHHAMIISVTPEVVRKQIIYQKRAENLKDGIKHFAVVKAYPWFSEHIFAAVIINIVLAFAIVIWTRTGS